MHKFKFKDSAGVDHVVEIRDDGKVVLDNSVTIAYPPEVRFDPITEDELQPLASEAAAAIAKPFGWEIVGD